MFLLEILPVHQILKKEWQSLGLSNDDCPHLFVNKAIDIRCFGCARSSCALAGRTEGGEVDIAPCAEPGCNGKMRLSRVSKGFLVSCNKQGCKSTWWLPKRGISSGK